MRPATDEGRIPLHQGSGGAAMRRLLLTSCLVSGVAMADAATLEITASRDNTMFSDTPTYSSGAGPALFAGNNGSGFARRALIHFQITALPPGAHLDSATVTLEVSNAPNPIPRRFTLYRVLREWGEGASISSGGAGVTAETGDATWTNAFHPGLLWAAPGGDFDPNPSAARAVEGLGASTWSGAGIAADIEAWMRQPDSNHGWLLVGEEEGLNTARRFSSREAGDARARPTLTIYFTPAALARGSSWGSVKARYR